MPITPLPPIHHHRRGRSLAGALAAIAVSGLTLVATAAPASATNEFPAKPTAEATIGCDDGAAVVSVDLGNLAGLSSAHFEVTETGQAPAAYDVAAGSSSNILHYGAPENSDVTVAITADDGFTYTKTLTANCFDFVGGITLTCDGLQPLLTAEVSAIGTFGDNLDFTVNGSVAGSEELYSGSSTTFTAEVPDEVAFTSTLVSPHDGTITDLSGTPHCAPEPTTTTSTLPTPPTPTDPPLVIAQQGSTPAPYVPAPYVAPTELPRTGSSTMPLAILGTTLLGLGIAARRFAARRI